MKSPFPRAAAAVMVVAIGAAGFLLAGRDSASHDHGPARPGFTEFTGQGADWPPQMEGIESVRAVASESPDGAGILGVGDLLESEDVRDALGERFVASGEGAVAGDARRRVFFSHDNNATVEVVTTDRSVAEVIVTPASVYQPPETIQEASDAAELARDALVEAGHTGVEDLDGFGILAFPDDDAAFFENRVLCVSFHEDEDSRPEYVAWVDLTTREVVRAVPESELTS